MFIRLLKILGLLLALVLVAFLLAPFLISTQPAEATAPPPSVRGGGHLQVPFPGTTGIDLHYRERRARHPGGGRVFLLLHGFTFNLFTWDGVLDGFPAGRVIAYDQIPYGLSAKLQRGDWSGPNPYAKDAAIARLFSFMDALSVERAILVGSSSGGTLAMEAALARPARVEGLILVAPWVYARRPTIPAWIAELPQLRRLSLLIGRKLGEGVLLEYSYADAGRITDDRRALMAAHQRLPAWDLAWGELLTRSLYSPVEVSGRLAQIPQPTLLVTGDADKLVPVADTAKVAEGLPNAELRILEGCGHVPHEECPEAFRRVVSEWLETGAARGREQGEGEG